MERRGPTRSQGTSTSSFGVGRRESHDASDFYARFTAPELSDADDVAGPVQLAVPWIKGDIRLRDDIPDDSVALVVTSPPYFAGKEYEEALGENGVPGSYLEYLDLLRGVFERCKQKLEPGGRMAINIANLGRKPYRSLSADVIRILQDDLKLLLRGEVIWKKGNGAAGNCAWGSFRSAANPVLRDITERVVIVSKGRFGRARTVLQRRTEGLPWENSLSNDEFMQATLDVWEMSPEMAKRVNHPAPFPVELPERLVHLYTYKGDLVLDPFMGSGSTLVAAARTGRCYIGYDLEERYVRIARQRVEEEMKCRQRVRVPTLFPVEPVDSEDGVDLPEDTPDSFQARATQEGKAVRAIAQSVLERAGFEILGKSYRLPKLGVAIDFVGKDVEAKPWYFDVTGAFTTTRSGLLQADTLWKCLGRAHVIANNLPRDRTAAPLVLLTSHLPKPGSEGDVALRAAGPTAFFDAIEMLSREGQSRLARYAAGGHHPRPLPGFWRPGY